MVQRPKDVLCQVVSHEELLPGVFRTLFRPTEDFPRPLAGQFLQVEPSQGLFPATRRPFTVNRLVQGDIEIVFDVVGRGTGVMANFSPGSTVRVLGPLGMGWRTDVPGKWLLIGGGLGAAGFQFLMDTVDCSGVLIGAAGNHRVLPLDGSAPLHIATEDGSMGEKGLVTGLMNPELLAGCGNIAICGPVAMMHAVWNSLPDVHRKKVQVSTESRMGCGWGVCEGCSIPASQGGYVKCCQDGPVFPGSEIDWDRWKEAGL